MVRGIISNSTLSESLLGEALNTTTYILNRVPTKANTKAPYKLWTGRKPSLKNLVVTLLDTLNTLGAIIFMIPHLRLYLRWEPHNFLRMLSLGGIRLETLFLGRIGLNS